MVHEPPPRRPSAIYLRSQYNRATVERPERDRLPKSLAMDSGLAPPPETVQWLLARSSSKSPARSRIKPLTTNTQAGNAIATDMLTSPAINSASATR